MNVYARLLWFLLCFFRFHLPFPSSSGKDSFYLSFAQFFYYSRALLKSLCSVHFLISLCVELFFVRSLARSHFICLNGKCCFSSSPQQKHPQMVWWTERRRISIKVYYKHKCLGVLSSEAIVGGNHKIIFNYV